MKPDADAVLWALRGLQDSSGRGVRANDVARFMSKDATLSERYSCADVAVVLDSLVEERTLMHASEADTGDVGENASSAFRMRYRFATSTEVLRSAVVGFLPGDYRYDQLDVDDHAFFLGAVAEDVTAEVEENIAFALGSQNDGHLNVRIEELEREQEALTAERDMLRRRAESADEALCRLHSESGELRARIRELDGLLQQERALSSAYRQRAEAAEQQLSRSHSERDQLRERAQELNNLLEQERVLSSQRLQTTRRAAAALAHARHELERLEPSPNERPQSPSSRHRVMLRGNWLQ